MFVFLLIAHFHFALANHFARFTQSPNFSCFERYAEKKLSAKGIAHPSLFTSLLVEYAMRVNKPYGFTINSADRFVIFKNGSFIVRYVIVDHDTIKLTLKINDQVVSIAYDFKWNSKISIT